MINITKSNNGIIFDGVNDLALPLNSIILVVQQSSDMIIFKSSIDYQTIVQAKWQDITINGEAVTKETIVDKFNDISNAPTGSKINAGTNITLQEEADGSLTISATGELGGTVAWADVTGKPTEFTPSAHNHVVANITDLQGKLDAKQDTLVSGTNIKTINGKEILGSGDIVIEGGTGDVTKQYVDEQLALKVDKTSYEADKATFALKTEIPSIEGLATSEELQNGLNGKQDKGDYALKSELPDISGLATKEELALKADASALNAKQDTLVSGTNIKTINGQTILGEGNIEIQGGGGGIADAPSDGKLYGRQNGNWSEVVIPSTDNFATKEELESKADKTAIADMLTKTEASSTYQPKGEYLTSIPDEYITETELNEKGYATTTQLDAKLDTETYNTDKATFATKEELNLKANTSDLSNYVTTVNAEATYAKKADIPSLDGYLQTSVAETTYAKKNEIPEAYTLPIATAEALGGIKVGAGLSINPETGVLSSTGGGVADSVDWANITSKPETFKPEAHQHVTADITDLQEKLDGKVDDSEIADMATKTWVGEQGFLTSHQDISGLATKQEVTEGLATKQDKGNYITVESADEKYATKTELSGKADATAISDMLTKTEASSTYQPKGEYLTEIPSEYVTDDELNAKGYKKIEYLTQTQYDELPNKEEGVMYVITDAPEVVIPDTSTLATKEELNAKQDVLVSGTNIKTINGNTLLGEGDIVIEGGGSSQVVWDLQANTGNTEYITNFYNNAKIGDVVKYNNSYNNNIIITLKKNEYSELINCVLSPQIGSSDYQPNMVKGSIYLTVKKKGTITEGNFLYNNIKADNETINVNLSSGDFYIKVSDELSTKIKDSLSKTEASTTYKTIASEWYGTQSEYDLITEKDPNVTYFITEG